MNALAGKLRVEVVLPLMRMTMGAFTMDPVAMALGADPATVLKPWLFGPIREEVTETGRVEVFPLAFADGDGIGFSTRWGPIGLGNQAGRLYVDVPTLIAHAAEQLVQPDDVEPRPDARRWLARMTPGRVIGFSVGVGNVTVRAV